MSTVAALHFVLGRFETTSYEGFYRLFEMRMPLLTLAAILIGVSAMSGVVEEAAFRGYMQTSIERRHGIVIAILLRASSSCSCTSAPCMCACRTAVRSSS